MLFYSLRCNALISLGYLAGLVDGEGYVALAKIRRPNRAPEYCLRLVIYNTNREILTQVQRSWGGTLSAVGQRHPRWKPSFAIIWTNAAAAELLRYLAPYLRIKSRQADLLLSYQNRVHGTDRPRRPDGSLRPLPARERLRREALFRQLKRLNTRDKAIRGRQSRGPLRNGPPGPPSPRYVAGLVDGEGSLMIVRSKAGGRRNLDYRARVSISNTDTHVLETIRGRFGGMLEDQPPRKPRWNRQQQLIWSEGMGEPLLQSLLPHLRIKQRQARLLLDFMAHKRGTQQGHVGKYFAPLCVETMALREAFYREVSALNARGTD